MSKQYVLFKEVFLDVAGTLGMVTAVSPAVALEGDNNAYELWLSVKAIEGTTPEITCQAMVSVDGETWDKVTGTAPTANVFGQHRLPADTAVTAPYIRYDLTISGTNAKALVGAVLSVSSQ